MGMTGWSRWQCSFHPVLGPLLSWKVRGVNIPIAAWALIGLLATLFTAGALRQKANGLQNEFFTTKCRLRSQVVVAALASQLQASQAFAELLSSLPASDDSEFGQFASSIYKTSPVILTFQSRSVLEKDRRRIEDELGAKFWTLDTTTVPPSAIPVPSQEQYNPVVMHALGPGASVVGFGLDVTNWKGFNLPPDVLRRACDGASSIAGQPRNLSGSTVVPIFQSLYSAPASSTDHVRAATCIGALGTVFNLTSILTSALDQFGDGTEIVVSVLDVTFAASVGNEVDSAWGLPTKRGALYSQGEYEEGSHSKEEVITFELAQRQYEVHCRDRPKSLLMDPKEGGFAAVITGGVLLTMVAVVMGLRRVEVMQKNVEQVKVLNEELRNAKAQAESARAEAEAADMAKSNFLATMSHEIRTPLSGVLGMISLLNETQLDVVQQDYVQCAQASGQGLSGIINDVLDFCKIEAGHMDIENIPYNVRKEMEVVATLFADKARQKRLDLVFLIQDEVPEMLVGDPNRIRQALVNLVGNAIKFTNKGSIFVWVRIDEPPPAAAKIPSPETPGFGGPTDVSWFDLDKMFAERPGILSFDPRLTNNTLKAVELAGTRAQAAAAKARETGYMNLVFTVEDTGMGIPHSVQHRLFQPFVQADSSHTRKWGGSGIGLCITAKLVKSMGGLMTVASVENRGSRFSFSVHNGVYNKVANEPPPFGPNSGSGAASRLRVTVVDSNPVRGSAVCCTLKHLGAEAVVVGSPSEAVSCISAPDSMETFTPPLRKPRCRTPVSPRENGASKTVGERLASGRLGPERLALTPPSAAETLAESSKSKPVAGGSVPVADLLTEACRKLDLNLPRLQLEWNQTELNRGSSQRSETTKTPILSPRYLVSPQHPQNLTPPRNLASSRSPHPKSAQKPKPPGEILLVNWESMGKEGTAQLFHSLRETCAKPPPVLAITAHLKDHAREEALQSGCAEVLGWPLRELPIVTAVQKALGMEADGKRRPVTAVKYLEGKKALVVDDNQINRKLAGRILEGRGCGVAFATSGAEAIERVQEAHETGGWFDLVLMDLQMPEMDGYEAVQRLRAMESSWAQNKTLFDGSGKETVPSGDNVGATLSPRRVSVCGKNFAPHVERSGQVGSAHKAKELHSTRLKRMAIVAVSADVKKGVKEKCFEVGMTEYISKPFEQKRLREVLLAALEAEAATEL